MSAGDDRSSDPTEPPATDEAGWSYGLGLAGTIATLGGRQRRPSAGEGE
ncbi:cytochrome c oxidase subunit I [Natrinema pallidum DSM 3751]|uniref:Cytochrome c oxidase subunit I n=1 Tax=Natrinema pallidum DSM 3751 TaxID=1227495 RepID=L9Z7H4_9EURY|nr:cytochrome c oxidase subunit I [Natrinema pallidum DSM 3751]